MHRRLILDENAIKAWRETISTGTLSCDIRRILVTGRSELIDCMTFRVACWAATLAVVGLRKMVCRAAIVAGECFVDGIKSNRPLNSASIISVWETAWGGFYLCSLGCAGEDILACRSYCGQGGCIGSVIPTGYSRECDRHIPETLTKLTSTVAQITIAQMFHVRSGDLSSNTLAATIKLMAAAQMLHSSATVRIESFRKPLTRSQK